SKTRAKLCQEILADTLLGSRICILVTVPTVTDSMELVTGCVSASFSSRAFHRRQCPLNGWRGFGFGISVGWTTIITVGGSPEERTMRTLHHSGSKLSSI